MHFPFEGGEQGFGSIRLAIEVRRPGVGPLEQGRTVDHRTSQLGQGRPEITEMVQGVAKRHAGGLRFRKEGGRLPVALDRFREFGGALEQPTLKQKA